ncbi:MAG: Ig-like domain-containing protein [Prevotella sp.]|nr:Ig-like domain-containing protein [Prevotella sp.]
MKLQTKTYTAILFLTLLTAVSGWAQTVTKRGVVYTLTDDHYEATAFDAASAETDNWNNCIVIEDAINGVPVTAVANGAFDGTVYYPCANKAQSISLGANIKSVGDFAFYLCRNVTEVSFNAEIQTIGVKALYGCNALKEATFLGNPPQVGFAAFYNVGSVAAPVQVTVPVAQLTAYLDKMEGSGESYGWASGNGCLSLRTESDGLVYQVLRGAATESSTLRIVGVGSSSLVNKGTVARPAYLIQAPSAVQGYSVSSLADGSFLSGCDENVYAIDLREVPLANLTVSRSAEHFSGINSRTLIYVPDNNSSAEDNVIIGDSPAAALQVDTLVFTPAAISNGEATYRLNGYYSLPLFGQQIGTQQVPLPIADSNSQWVWMVDFVNDTFHCYRYANNGQTVSLPTAEEMRFPAGTALSFYKDGNVSQRFTSTTAITGNTVVYAYPQATGLSLDTDTLTLSTYSNNTFSNVAQLSATLSPAKSRHEVTWSSADTQIVTVDGNGVVRAVGAGKTTVTVTSVDNPSLQATCRITVIPKISGITLSETSIVIPLSASQTDTYQLSATVQPAEAIADLVWESQDHGICTVDATGLVTAVGIGSTAVAVMPKDYSDVVAVCYVNVISSATSVWINRSSYVMRSDEQTTLQAKVLPSTAPQQVEWVSSDPAVAQVSADGVVTAVHSGTATITATSVARPELSNSCVITVVGIGTQTTIQGVTYQVTALDNGKRTVAVVHLSDSLLNQGGERKFANQINYARADFDVTEVADDAIGQLQHNTLYYIPAYIQYKGTADNVLVADENGVSCRRLVISEDDDFETSYAFTADEVVAVRTAEPLKAFTFSMPYSIESDPQTIRFYDMKEQDADTLVCYEVSRTEAYKPYIAVSSAATVDLGGQHITVAPYRRNTDVYVGEVQFMATMRHLDKGYLSGVSAFLLNDRSWQPVSDDTVIQPMTAWLATTHSPLYVKLVNGGSTAIHSIHDGVKEISRIYDLQGRPVSGVSDLPKGIYIRNGRKFVKK